jgi:serine/threonine-protein kinase
VIEERPTASDDFLGGEPLDGKYRIEQLLGHGGMGAVYRATHLGTTRTVAVKIIHPHFSSDQRFVDRFRREAEASGRLRHPNVVDVTDFGFAQTRRGAVAYLVMEYLDGRSLGAVLEAEGRLSPASVVDILEQVSSAAAEAHRLGIVHRDLKPDNIWLEPNRRGGFTVKVLDFGLAKLAGTESPTVARAAWVSGPDSMTGAFPSADSGMLTQAGAVMGTPLYMSPEQCRGAQLDTRSDIYSLGVVAYHMLAGEPPFTGSAAELIERHASSKPPDLRARCPDVPRRLAAVVMSALEKDPAVRPDSAAGFGSALRASAEGSSALLRHAVSLYSDHFPTFLKLSLLANAPLILFATGVALVDWLTPDGSGISLVSLLILLGMIASNLFAYVAVAAATAPVVWQLTHAPLRHVSIATSMAAVMRRGAAFTGATLAVLSLTLVGLVLLILPGVVFLVWHSLYGPIVIMEPLSVGAALRRARVLFRRVWSTALVITALQFALPLLVWIAAVDSTFTLRFDEHWQPRELGFGLSMSSGSLIYQFLNVLVTPLAGIMNAQLYLKARHAGGEILEAGIAIPSR